MIGIGNKRMKIDKNALTANEHIAKIAALPRGIKICVFLRSLLALIKCWEAATSAICHHVSCQARTTDPVNDRNA